MTDGDNNKIEQKGEETTKESVSDYEKLKSLNDEFEKELIRGRELKAEKQKLEAEQMLGGDNGGHIEPEVKEVTPQEYAKKVMDGEIGDAKQE